MNVLPRPSFVGETAVNLPGWARLLIFTMSNATLMVEMALPIIALHPRRRASSVLGLLALKAVILGLSGEVSFSFTVIAWLLSFFPRSSRGMHALAVVLLAAYALTTAG